MKTEDHLIDGMTVREALETLKESCNEGLTGEWDSGSGEGRESFGPMIDHLDEVIVRYDALVSVCRSLTQQDPLTYGDDADLPTRQVYDLFNTIRAEAIAALRAAGVEL